MSWCAKRKKQSLIQFNTFKCKSLTTLNILMLFICLLWLIRLINENWYQPLVGCQFIYNFRFIAKFTLCQPYWFVRSTNTCTSSEFQRQKRCNSEGVRRSYVLWTIKCISRRFMDKRRHYLPTAIGLVCLADVAVKQFDQHECFSAWQRICNAIISMLTLLFNESRCARVCEPQVLTYQ